MADTNELFVVILIFFLFRLRSMEELDRNVREGRFRQLIPAKEKMPSHDAARNDRRMASCSDRQR